MPLFKVSHEIEVEADSPLEAAYKVNHMMDNRVFDSEAIGGWQFYVQEENSTEVFSVDLDEEDENAVLPVKKYEPFIK